MAARQRSLVAEHTRRARVRVWILINIHGRCLHLIKPAVYHNSWPTHLSILRRCTPIYMYYLLANERKHVVYTRPAINFPRSVSVSRQRKRLDLRLQYAAEFTTSRLVFAPLYRCKRGKNARRRAMQVNYLDGNLIWFWSSYRIVVLLTFVWLTGE